MKYLRLIILITSCLSVSITTSMYKENNVRTARLTDLAHRSTHIAAAYAKTAEIRAEINSLVSQFTDPYEVSDADYTGHLAFGAAGLSAIGAYGYGASNRSQTDDSITGHVTQVLHSKEAQYAGWGLAGGLALWHWLIKPWQEHRQRIRRQKAFDRHTEQLEKYKKELEDLSSSLTTQSDAIQAGTPNEHEQLETLYGCCLMDKLRMDQATGQIESLGAQLRALWDKPHDSAHFNTVLAAYSSLCTSHVFWQEKNRALLETARERLGLDLTDK